MTTFDDKEKAAENKYAHDKELEFKIHARAHKLLGLWAAGKMGLGGSQADEYAAQIVVTDVTHTTPQPLFDRIKTDLWAKDVHLSDHDIKLEMHRLEHIAREQMAGK